jgi:hypothetical protein
MAKVVKKVDLEKLSTIKDDSTLIAVIGTEKKPIYAVFYKKSASGLSYCITVESPANIVYREFVNPSKAKKIAKRIIETYTEVVEAMEENDKEEPDEVTYYCNNPDCGAKGVITEPIMDEAGKMTCPFCGKELDEEEVDYDFDIKYDRLMEIAGILLTYIECADVESAEALKDCYNELEEWGIEEEELNYIAACREE